MLYQIGDRIIVPDTGVFSMYKITGKLQTVGVAFIEPITDENEDTVMADGDYIKRNEERVDLGFVISVKLVEKEIPRAEYAGNSLLSRMKIQQTSAI